MASVTQIPFLASDLFKWVSYGPCVIRRFHGWNNTASAVYIQFHQVPPLGTTTPYTNLANGTVPTAKSFVAQANNGFDYAHEDLSLTECTVCLSSTETSLTAVAASSALDMTIEVDTMYPVAFESQGAVGGGANVAISGDLSTGVDSLTVWSDIQSHATDRLLRVTYTNNDGVVRYLQLFADTSAVNPTPLQQWQVGTTSAQKTLDVFFGTRGMPVYIADRGLQNTLLTTGTGEHWGCQLAQSSTAGSLTLTASAVSFMRAIYRANQ